MKFHISWLPHWLNEFLLDKLQPANLRFLGHAIKIEPAADPDTLLWENLDFPPDAQRWAQRKAAVLTGVCLFVR
jgi:hypothetical protein